MILFGELCLFRYKDYLDEIPVIAAPLADYTDYPFRYVMRKFFQGLIFTEMISLNALDYDDEKTWKMIETAPQEKGPIGIQVFGGKADVAGRAVSKLKRLSPQVIDINFACPVRKVIKIGAGAGVLNEPERGLEIVRAVKENFDGEVSVKLRLGVQSDTVEYFLERLVHEGISAVTIHGRTVKQMYSGIADRRRTLELAKQFPIPIVVSGDVFSSDDVNEILEGGAEGVLVARGMIGRPWFLTDAVSASRKEAPLPVPKISEVALMHMNKIIECYGDRGLSRFRNHLAGYAKGFHSAGKIRHELVTAKSFIEVEKILKRL